MRSKTYPMLISPELFLSKTLKTDWYSCLSILKSSNAELDEGGYWPPPPASIVIILVNQKLQSLYRPQGDSNQLMPEDAALFNPYYGGFTFTPKERHFHHIGTKVPGIRNFLSARGIALGAVLVVMKGNHSICQSI